MKYLFMMAVLGFSLSSFASERSFRIVPGSSTTSGYAIAWGMPGQNIDFEKIEAEGDESVEKFMSENFDKLANFVVDTERNVILSTIQNDEGLYATLGGHYYGNHYYLSISEFASAEVAGIEYEQNVIVVNTHGKWGGGLSKAFMVRKDDRSSTFVKDLTMTTSLFDATKALLTVEQQAILERVATDEDITVDNMMKTKASITGEIPKCTEKCVTVDIKSDLSMEVKDNNLVFTLSNVVFKADEYTDND